MRAAARHGLKISNPDLGKAVEEERRMNREEGGGLRAKTEIFGRYFLSYEMLVNHILGNDISSILSIFSSCSV